MHGGDSSNNLHITVTTIIVLIRELCMKVGEHLQFLALGRDYKLAKVGDGVDSEVLAERIFRHVLWHIDE